MSNNKYLIALDMDGTLLNDKKEISFITKHYLRKISKQGHKVIIASGRPYRSIKRYYESLRLHTPVICYNGIYSFNPNDSTYPVTKTLFSKKEVLTLYKRLFPKYVKNFFIETKNDLYLFENDDNLLRFFVRDGMNLHYGELPDTIDEESYVLIFERKEEASDKEIREQVKDMPNLSLRFWGHREYFEIFPTNESKGKMVLKIAKDLGVDKERIIAIGDAENDIEMISSVGHGVSMKNGYPPLKAIARHVTKKDNNHNGIVHCLKQILLKY